MFYKTQDPPIRLINLYDPIKEIKTIWERADDYETFDKKVNRALKDGWKLVKREFHRTTREGVYSMLYAELERVVEESEDK